jgi:putative endonuclease
MSVVRVRAGEPTLKALSNLPAGLFLGTRLLFFVYILQSESTGRYYCGQTNDLDRRFREHNDPAYYSSKTTKRFAGPWRLVCSNPFDNRSDAMNMETRAKKRSI